MRLIRARVQTYRSIVNSGIVEIEEGVAVIIGKNKQGRTSFIRAIRSFNSERRNVLKLLRLTLTCCLAAWPVTAAPPDPKTARPADAKQRVLDLENEWVAAEHNHDAAALRRILDDKFVASFGAEKPYDKETFIKELISHDVDPTESQMLTDRTVIIDHDTAVVVGTDTERGTRKGAAYTAVAKYTVTYIRRHGRWVALAEHLVEVPKGK